MLILLLVRKISKEVAYSWTLYIKHSLILILEGWAIPRAQLDIKSIVGKGEFGGYYNEIMCY